MSLTAPIRLRVVPRLIPVDGKNVELRSTSNAVEWRNEGDANWQVLVPISELVGPEGPKGDKGDAGQDGIMASIQPGDNVSVDATDPANPVISTPSVSYAISQSLSTSQRLQAQANVGLPPDVFNNTLFPDISDFFSSAGEKWLYGEHDGNSISIPPNSSLHGLPGARLNKNGPGALLHLANPNGGYVVTDLVLNNNYDSLGVGGFPIRLRGPDNRVERVTMRDYGAADEGSGAAVHIAPAADEIKPVRQLLRDLRLYANTAADINVGWLAVNTDTSFFESIYSHGHIQGIGYAHELKEDSRHNVISNLITEYSQVGLAYGQSTRNGAKFNLAQGLVSKTTRVGYVLGQCSNNLLNGLLFDATEKPLSGEHSGASIATSNENASFAMLTKGAANSVRIASGDRNYFEIAGYDSTRFARIDTGYGNVVELTHTGSKTTISGNYIVPPDQVWRGANANVIYSPSTGEYFGTRSGYFHFLTGLSGAARNSNRHFVFESDGQAALNLLTPGATGDSAGLTYTTPASGRQGGFTYVKGANDATDYWVVRVGNADVVQYRPTGARPVFDNSYALGADTYRWREVFTVSVNYGGGVLDIAGSGDPEGVITAAVGSTYRRTDGGAGSTFYVKESGAGNVGWVAK